MRVKCDRLTSLPANYKLDLSAMASDGEFIFCVVSDTLDQPNTPPQHQLSFYWCTLDNPVWKQQRSILCQRRLARFSLIAHQGYLYLTGGLYLASDGSCKSLNQVRRLKLEYSNDGSCPVPHPWEMLAPMLQGRGDHGISHWGQDCLLVTGGVTHNFKPTNTTEVLVFSFFLKHSREFFLCSYTVLQPTLGPTGKTSKVLDGGTEVTALPTMST